MAGDWIKMRASLFTNPKVLMIAEIIGDSVDVGRRMSTGHNASLSDIVTRDVTRDVTVSGLLRVWCATNEHTVDGVWHNSTLKVIDQVAGIPGFGLAMEAAGWALVDLENGTVTMPNFLENNAPAKNNARSSAAERQARYREKKKGNNAEVTHNSDVTRDVTSNAREEKRREDINTPSLHSGVVRERSKKVEKPESVSDSVWQDFQTLRKTKKAPVTETVLKAMHREADKAGVSIEVAMQVCCETGWQAFNAGYYANRMASRGFQQGRPTETAYQRGMRERVAEACPDIAREAPNAVDFFKNVAPIGSVVEVEAREVRRIEG